MDAMGVETHHVSLRPPLPWLPSSRGDATREDDWSSSSFSSFWILLIRSYLACDVLRLSTETRFTALVLLHRYYYHFSARTKSSLVGVKDGTFRDEKDDDNGEGGDNTTADDNLRSGAERTTTNHDDDDDDDDDDGNWPWIAAACIFLACKAEEEPRRLRDVVNMVHTVLLQKEQQPGQPGQESECATSTTTTIPQTPLLLQLDLTPPPLHQDYWASKRRVIDTEQVVLRWLGFDVSVSHPHRCVLLILDLQQQQQQQRHQHQQQQHLVGSGSALDDDKTNSHNSNKTDHGRPSLPPSPPPGLVLVSFRRLNDALFSARALRHPLMVLACAAMELALDELLPSTQRRNKDEEEDNDDNAAVTSFEGFHSLFGPAWWTSYSVSAVSLKSCKNDLEAATASLMESSSSSASQAATF